jgi:hypothetical protein
MPSRAGKTKKAKLEEAAVQVSPAEITGRKLKQKRVA